MTCQVMNTKKATTTTQSRIHISFRAPSVSTQPVAQILLDPDNWLVTSGTKMKIGTRPADDNGRKNTSAWTLHARCWYFHRVPIQ